MYQQVIGGAMMLSTRMDIFTHDRYAENIPDKLTYLLMISGAILFLMIVIIAVV